MSSSFGPIVAAVCVTLASLVFAIIFHRKIHHSILESHHDVLGIIYSTMGVMFSILLAFVVVVVWEEFREAEDTVLNEANHAANLFRDTAVFPEPARGEIRGHILEYIKAVVEKDWPVMAQGRISEESSGVYTRIWKSLQAFSPTTDQQAAWYDACVGEINELGNDRRHRLMSAEFAVPPFMWTIMLIGAAFTIFFVFLFGTERLAIKLILVATLSISVCLVFLLIDGLEHPYSGIISVSPEPFVMQLKHLSAQLAP